MPLSVSRFTPWLGTWEGEGRGQFPTIAPFEYRERLVLQLDHGRDLVALECQAVKLHSDGSTTPSHYEVGTIIAADGAFVMSTIQNGSRYERMRGALTENTLSWKSEAYAYDARLVETDRIWRLVDNRLEYQMFMSTRSVPTRALHLTASLHRART